MFEKKPDKSFYRETGLHYNTFRFYDPDVGRFTTPDPIELASQSRLKQRMARQQGPEVKIWVLLMSGNS